MSTPARRNISDNIVFAGEGVQSKHIARRIYQKCINLLNSVISMNFNSKPKYSKRSTLEIYVLSALTKSYIESTVSPFNGLGIEGAQSGDTAINRVKNKGPKEILEEFKKVNGKILAEAKGRGAFRDPVDAAIDFHKVRRHTKMRFKKRKRKCDDLPKAIGIKPKDGASLAHFYATIKVVNTNKHNGYTLGFEPVYQSDKRASIVSKLIQTAKEVTGDNINCIYGDGDFDDIEMVNVFNDGGKDYVVRMGKDRRVKRLIAEKLRGRWYHIEKDYVIGTGNRTARTNLIILDVDTLKEHGIDVSEKGEKDKYYTYATNKYPEKGKELDFCIENAKGYSKRWGIETGYRDIGEFQAKTHALSYSVRLWMFLLAVILYNLWVLINSVLESYTDTRGAFQKKHLTKSIFSFVILLCIILSLIDKSGSVFR